jgi:MFS transporter, AAHS family, 4-hydroxybenzoate transporter
MSESMTAPSSLARNERRGGAPVVALFADGRSLFTILIWIVTFMNLVNLYFLSNWLPVLTHSAGHSARAAVLVGTTLVGGQPAVNAFAARGYPTEIRATGIGWSLGVGRIGSVLGPVLSGQLLEWHWTTASLFLAASVPAAIAAILIGMLGSRTSNSSGKRFQTSH